MKSFLTLLCGLCALTLSAETITYVPDNTTVFPNPERGFTDELGGETALTDSKNHVVLPEEEWYWDEEEESYADRRTQSLVVLMYYLKNYASKDLSDKLLQGFDEDMQILRNHGFKCVLRFAYDWKSKNDASPQWVTRHIEQLKPHWAKNADVIFALEAGFVGEWGEWYYSAHFGNETQQLNDNRRLVLNALLDACPKDRFLLVRYPIIKTQFLGDENALTPEQAFGNTERARIGHHNDAFLAKDGNDGTYGRDGDGPDDDPVLRQYIADETLFVPNGGESNVENNSWAQKVYADAETEMERYHWTFCGAVYSEKITDRWRTDGIYTTLDKRLGYRFQLLSATVPETAAMNHSLPLQLVLRNVGFVPLYNKRTVYLTLVSESNTFALPLRTDPRRWTREAGEITIVDTLPIPASIPEGDYHLYLHLPDEYASLANDPRYAVRFANEDMWDESTGMNDLHASLRITSSTESVPVLSQPSEQCRKILRNGSLLILRGAETYSILGEKRL